MKKLLVYPNSSKNIVFSLYNGYGHPTAVSLRNTYYKNNLLEPTQWTDYEQIIIKSFARSNHFTPSKKASSETPAIS